MLQQLDRLSVEVDGRFASAEELGFLKAYLNSAEARITTYEKVREQAQEILSTWEEAKRNYPQDLFHMGNYDMTDICRRDGADVLRCSASTMLFDEPDRLKAGMLVWYETIAKAFGYKKFTAINYKLIQGVVKQFLNEKEAALMIPIFQLTQTVLSV
jgi:hypothetical protein